MNQFDFQRGVMASNLDGVSKWTLVVIGSHVNWKTGQAAFPSIDTLVKETGFSKATIHRAKLKLVSQGYLVSQRHFNKSNTYLVNIPDSLTERVDSLREILPSLTERLPMSHSEELKDNIKDNIKDKEKIIKEDDDSNESSYDNLIQDIKPEGVINLDTNEVSLLAEEGWGEASPAFFDEDTIKDIRVRLNCSKEEAIEYLKKAEELWA